MQRLVGLANGYLNRHAVAQQLIGPQVGLIQRDASGIRRSHQFLQCRRYLRIGVITMFQVSLQQLSLNVAILPTFAPLAR